MKKFIIPAAFALGLFLAGTVQAQTPRTTTGTETNVDRGQQDPTAKDPKVVNPEKKDADRNVNTSPSGKSEKIAIGEEGDADDKKKNSTGTKNPTLKPNTTTVNRDPK